MSDIIIEINVSFEKQTGAINANDETNPCADVNGVCEMFYLDTFKRAECFI